MALLDAVTTSKEQRRWLWERRPRNLRMWRIMSRVSVVVDAWLKRAQERAYAPGGIGFVAVQEEFEASAKRQRTEA